VAITDDTNRLLAARLVRHVVLDCDPAVPEIAADFWAYSEPHYRSVVAGVRALVGTAGPAAEALDRVIADPAAGVREPALVAALAESLRDDPAARDALTRTVEAADAEILIDYHRGARYDQRSPPVDLAELCGWTAEWHATASISPELLVVIPVMDQVGGARIRNLLATLLALGDQSLNRNRYHVTVVEIDAESRWRAVVEPLVNDYVFLRNDGMFNKSWAMNAGVTTTACEAPHLCVIDADILVDRDFLARNLDRLQTGEQIAHIPYRLCYSLDAPATSRAVRERCEHGRADVSVDVLRALVLRDPPGGCLWTFRKTFDTVGGYDERYLGWGGEDDDMWARLTAAGPVRRHDDLFLHLAHPRPVMVVDGRPINGHLKLGTWARDHGYGLLDGPSTPSDAARMS
jgi:hypothetical protein